MSGSLGLDHSRQDNSSQSQSYGYSGSSSSNISSSLSDSSSLSSSRQNIAFEDVFSQLYGRANASSASALLGASEISGAARQLFTGGSDLLSSLGGDAGSEYMEGRLTDENPMVQQQIDLLREDAGRLFSEEINPALTSNAVATGNLGGSRQGVAQGLALRGVQDTFARGAATIRSEDIARRDNIASVIAGNTLAGAQTGLGALPGLLDVLERGNLAELGVLGATSGVLGGPTVLSTSDSSSQSTSESLAEAFARSFGEQSSESKSKGKGRSYGFDSSFSWGGMGGGGG